MKGKSVTCACVMPNATKIIARVRRPKVQKNGERATQIAIVAPFCAQPDASREASSSVQILRHLVFHFDISINV